MAREFRLTVKQKHSATRRRQFGRNFWIVHDWERRGWLAEERKLEGFIPGLFETRFWRIAINAARYF